jgi:hypothetical protein
MRLHELRPGHLPLQPFATLLDKGNHRSGKNRVHEHGEREAAPRRRLESAEDDADGTQGHQHHDRVNEQGVCWQRQYPSSFHLLHPFPSLRGLPILGRP